MRGLAKQVRQNYFLSPPHFAYDLRFAGARRAATRPRRHDFFARR